MAHGTFEDIEQELPGLKDTIRLAKLYAQSSSPVLIEGYAGPEQDAICQGIHNYSLRKNNPFIAINLAGMSEDQQMKTLFGSADPKGKDVEKGAVWQADKGTLVIQSIDKMTLPVQYHFSKMLRSRRILFNSIENMKIVDIRIIACTSKDIDTCRRLNRMRSDLYYSLNALKIKIPGLCQRPDDMAYLLDSYMKKYYGPVLPLSRHYSRGQKDATGLRVAGKYHTDEIILREDDPDSGKKDNHGRICEGTAGGVV